MLKTESYQGTEFPARHVLPCKQPVPRAVESSHKWANAVNSLAANLGVPLGTAPEPLVEPGSMSRGVVKVDIGVSDQPPIVLGFMNIQNRITPVRLPLTKMGPPVLTTT